MSETDRSNGNRPGWRDFALLMLSVVGALLVMDRERVGSELDRMSKTLLEVQLEQSKRTNRFDAMDRRLDEHAQYLWKVQQQPFGVPQGS